MVAQSRQASQGSSRGAADRRGGAAQATQAAGRPQDQSQHDSASNIPSGQTAPEREYSDYVLDYEEGDAAFDGKIPDVLLDAPVVKLEDLDFELNDLRAKVSLFAKVLDLVELSVGIDAYLGRVKLTIKSIEVQALLKVRLDNVRAILDRVLTTVDRNPQIVHELARGVSSAVEDVGEGTGQLVGEGANEAVSDIGSGAGSAVEDVGEGASSAVEDVGGGAGEAVDKVGRGAGQAAGEVGQGVGQTAEQIGEGVGQGAQEVGRTAGQAQDAAGGAPQQAQDAAGQSIERGGEQQAPYSTRAAAQRAEELGLDLSQIEGSGSNGRITVRDVIGAAQNG